MIRAALTCTIAAAALWHADLFAATSPGQVRELSRLSLEELANIEVTSVSRRRSAQRRARRDLRHHARGHRRSGVTSIPEALRLAPNLQVARIRRQPVRDQRARLRQAKCDSANKLLVLIDGRSVYSPLFSGVFWDAQDVMLEDIERIEVISGPGATLWGANAVNGVINIITRPAAEHRARS